MANRTLFNTQRARSIQKANVINDAGGIAYSLSDEAALCQYVVTGTFNSVIYVDAATQLDRVKTLLDKVSPILIAKAAVYAHERGNMKDMPAYMLAYLASRGRVDLLRQVWFRVITNAKMLLNFVQIIRSGVTGRKSFGSAVRSLIREWLQSKNGYQLFLASVGHSQPSLADVIKMVHPRPSTDEMNNLYRYLIGKPFNLEMLPQEVMKFELFKKNNELELPNVPYFVLSNIKLTKAQWKDVARNLPWNTLRMNINKLQREGVFEDQALMLELASKLADEEEVRKFNAFPFQLMTTYQFTTDAPMQIRVALQDALEAAIGNIPKLNGQTVIAIDISGSMTGAVTGQRDGSTSKTRCIDVAALIAASVLRQNQFAKVIVWNTDAKEVQLNPRDSVMTNAQALARMLSGGTAASVPFNYIRTHGWKVDNVINVSDNQSWMDTRVHGSYYGGGNQATAMAEEWSMIKKHCKRSKLMSINLQPYTNSQIVDAKDVINIGGFSDAIFDVMGTFFNGSTDNFVDIVNQVEVGIDG